MTLSVIFFLLSATPCEALFSKKDYKQIFIQSAQRAEKRKNDKAAFNLFEKTMYYYKDDKQVLEEYAGFCERRGYNEKAVELYTKLYALYKDEYYLYRKYFNEAKSGKLDKNKFSKIQKDKHLKPSQTEKINLELIKQFSYNNDWVGAKKACDKVSPKNLNLETVVICTVSSEKVSDEKAAYKYYLRYYEVDPKNTSIIKRIIKLSDSFGDYKIEEKFLKIFSSQNPNDNGIKYSLAGFYEKQGNFSRAAKVYEALMASGDRSEHVKKSHAYALAELNPKKHQKGFQKRVLTEREIKENQLYEALRAKNYKKTLDITEDLLKKYPDDKKLLILALENSMAQNLWDKTTIYNEKLLLTEPDSEKFLKNRAAIFSIKKDFKNAALSYEKLIEKYPKPEYKFELANMYMANKEFEKAQEVIEPLYKENPENPDAVKALLNSLMAQNKTRNAYIIIKTHHLENTPQGYQILGDMAMLNDDYESASRHYYRALQADKDNLLMKNKLAETYRLLGYSEASQRIYEDILAQEPENQMAQIGLGYIQIDKKEFETARNIFNNILAKDPDYTPAKEGIVFSYIGNGDDFNTLGALNSLPQNDETKLLRAQTYYKMGMPDNAKAALQGSVTKEARDLRYKIRRDKAITVTPTYSFFFQQLAEQFKLDYHKFGVNVSQAAEGNKTVFAEYNVIVYSSGGLNQQNNVVNEFKGGVYARPTKELEYRADLGVKAFQFGNGAMIITDSWIKRYFNDNFAVKLGVKRNNVEQSYLSAVGTPIDGIFTGRAADNKVYLDLQIKLPKQCYAFLLGSYGAIYAQNLITNMYYEGMVGLGRLWYNNPKNPWLQRFSTDIISYNSSYQYNLLDLYSSTGQLYGGYFSPSYFNATTLNLKLEGEIKKWHLKYGIKGFGGIQEAITPDFTRLTWGVSPYATYRINDHIDIVAEYNHFTYANLLRDQFMISAVIKGFKNAKN
ncbi:MAG TPA: cellulose synthase subunit BcsC-related outer membrane protein [Candidatus Gastranaerophilaceae bacterium]|nr:cellulose synthase subunit BcsC-related outer membrane protein [Candidatus Gastranaerophilaceae bacterium]